VNAKIRLLIIYFVLIIFAAWFIFPIYWAITAALKESGEIFTNPWGLPSNPTLQNFIDAWILGGFSTAYINSIILTLLTTIVVIILSAMVAYPLSRFTFRLRNTLFYLIVSGYMIPPIAILIPFILC